MIRGDDVFKRVVHAIFMATTWFLWKHRNAIVFERVQPSSMHVVCEVRAMASLWLKVRSRNGGGMTLNNFPYDPG